MSNHFTNLISREGREYLELRLNSISNEYPNFTSVVNSLVAFSGAVFLKNSVQRYRRPEGTVWGRLFYLIQGTGLSSIAGYKVFSVFTKAIESKPKECFHMVNEKKLSCNEFGVFQLYGEKGLSWEESDGRKKVLYASAKEDFNGSMNFSIYTQGFKQLNEDYDVKFATVSKVQEICKLLSSQEVEFPIESVLIDAHGFPHEIFFSDQPGGRFYSWSKIPEKCFETLSPTAKIYLISCNSGVDLKMDISCAQHLADVTGRSVIAAMDELNLHKYQKEQMYTLFKESNGLIKNVTQLFTKQIEGN